MGQVCYVLSMALMWPQKIPTFNLSAVGWSIYRLLKRNKIFNFKVTCLITCLVLYWPKIIEFYLISCYFGIGSVSSFFIWLKISLLDVKMRKKKERQTFRTSLHLSHWRGPPYVAETFAFLSFCALVLKFLETFLTLKIGI